MRFSISIEGVTADLFDDEAIVLTRQIKDFSKVESVYTDYTQSFQLPATDINNRLFYNWFDENIFYANWNPNIKLAAIISIDSIPVFYGSIELLQVDYRNGLPMAYSVAFYGQIKNILAQWGEVTLQELDWSDFDHLIDNPTMVSSWTGGINSGDIIWDIKDYNVGYTFSRQRISNNIYYNQGGDGIDFTDLRPSIRLKAMVNHIFTKFGYTLSGNLFDRGEFTNLYVTPMGNAGPMLDYDDLQFGNFEADNIGSALNLFPYASTKSTWQNLEIGSNVTYNPSGAWDNSTYEYTIPRNGDYIFEMVIAQNSVNPSQFANYVAQLNGVMVDAISGDDFFMTNYQWTIKIKKAQMGQKFRIQYAVYTNVQVEGTMKCIESPYTMNPSVVMSNSMPTIKLSDFINSVLQTFNAVLIPISDTEISIYNLDDWYSLGANKDYTKYINFEGHQHKKIDIPAVVSMSHKKSESAPNILFRDTYGRDYGSVEFKPDVDFASGELKIETLFSAIPPSRMNEVNSLGHILAETDIDLPIILGKDYKPIQEELILFYFQDFKNTNSWYRLGGNSLTYQPVSASYTNTPTTGASSISCTFGLESSAEGDIPTQTLYMNFWHEFISRLYSTRTRVFICNAYIPVGEWLKMALNDNIVVSGNYYKIQKIEYNILTEEAKLELVSYPKVNKVTINGSTGKKPIIISPVENADGSTYLDGIPFNTAITNSIYYSASGNYVANPSDIVQFNSGLAVSLDSMLKTIQQSNTINRVMLWEESPTSIMVDPNFQSMSIGNVGYMGDESLWSTGTNTEITILQDGQYRAKGIVVVDHSGGSSVTAIQILLNGVATEGYNQFDGNHVHTINLEAMFTATENSIISMGIKTEDGGTHNVDIKQLTFTIQKLF